MGSSTHDNLHGKMKRMIMELLKGKEIAVQLQNLLEKAPATVGAADHEKDASAGKLVLQIMRSFSNTISELSSTNPAQIPSTAVDRGERRKKPPPKTPVFKNRRGCYKRRRSSDSESWIVESSTTEDGFAWRKYGQKIILNTEFPRCYYRCTYKYEGCKATKQVQMIKSGKPHLFQTTYINHHTCTKTATTNLIHFCPSDSAGSRNIISFQKKHGDDHNLHNPTVPSTISSLVKLENHNTTTNDDQQVPSHSKSTTLVLEVEDLIGPEYSLDFPHPLGQEEMGLGLQYVDDNQFSDDFGSFFCFGSHMYDNVL